MFKGPQAGPAGLWGGKEVGYILSPLDISSFFAIGLGYDFVFISGLSELTK